MIIYILQENVQLDVISFKENKYIAGIGEFKNDKFLLRFKDINFKSSELYEIDMSKFNNNFMKKVKYCYYDISTDSFHKEAQNYSHLKKSKITNSMIDYLEDKIDDLLLEIWT